MKPGETVAMIDVSTAEAIVKFLFKVSLGTNNFEHLTMKNLKCKKFKGHTVKVLSYKPEGSRFETR
jgi:hypothetical protein